MPRVFEGASVWAGQGETRRWVNICEREKGIDISTGYYTVQMSPTTARRLARMLHRAAKRVEAGT